ncbi:putative peptidoglycan hydrolase [uncultured Mediterranean phage uvMED]|nr:putative peptidoglycan hydrolase [uncultured Mediterranean phage uvMED]BAQ89770.1 putative peptidoglycan hydrolase [uncultured Mediterranean phage uvMED]BAQ89772.1 putative peptidoglycan hydrolase [uncultured Mediterranean phage uvMED]BAR19199.1 putative peptidoglycan hydrolase [uncultured Mediterranean phage uvMED]BAR19263.1 putative peptidoglycan hydrolase [uncultured Mediterranean phage uvMED]|tara:strand:+ start:244 stop:1971 length:1728 start_codon:yes stop_codon:yes gene_type:complete
MIKDYDFRDFAGAAARAFNTLRFEPDKGLNQALQTIQQQRTANRAKNKTVEYLKSLGTPMGDRLAGMVGTGQLKGSQAYGMMFDMEKEARAEERARNLATFQNQLAMDRDAAKPVKATNAQVLHNMAINAGHPEGSDMYNQIVFKLPAEKQLSPEVQEKMRLAEINKIPEGSAEYMRFVYGDEIPLTMPSGMDVNLYNKFDAPTQQAITASFGAGVPFPQGGTQDEKQAYINSVMKVRDKLGQEGTILKPTDAQYQEFVKNAFGEDFDMKQGIGGVITKMKDGTIEFTSFSSGKTDINVNVDTGKKVEQSEAEIIEQMAKKEQVPVLKDPNDPSQGFKYDENTGALLFQPAAGSSLALEQSEKRLAQIKSNFARERTASVKTDNITNSANRILDILVGEVNSKTQKRPEGKNAKYNKSTIARMFTFDPPEAGVRGQAFGNLGIFSSTESRNVANYLENIKSNIGFDRLQLMREMSTTGAGLGQVSNLELTQLNNSFVALQQDLQPADLAKNVQTIVDVYTKIINDPIAQAVKSARTEEEAIRIIEDYNSSKAESGDGGNIIFGGGDGSYTIKVKE